MLDIMVKSGRGLNKECGYRCSYKLIKWPYLCKDFNYPTIKESNLFLLLFCHIEIFQNIVIRCVLGTTFVIALLSVHYRG